MSRPRIQITLIDQKEQKAATGDIKSAILTILTQNAVTYAPWQCMWHSLM